MTLNDGALNAPNTSSRVVRKQVKHMVVQTNPPPKPRKPCNIKETRRKRLELETGLTSSRWFYDPLGTWPSFADSMSDVSVGEHGPGTREIACGPSLYIDQRGFGGYLWIDRSVVKDEPTVCPSAVPPVVISPVVRPVVVSWEGPGVMPVANGSNGPISCRSNPVEVNHPIVGFALSNVRKVVTGGVN